MLKNNTMAYWIGMILKQLNSFVFEIIYNELYSTSVTKLSYMIDKDHSNIVLISQYIQNHIQFLYNLRHNI